MKKIYITAFFVFGLMFYSNAQSFWSLNWDISKGNGDTGDFIGKISARGVSIDGRYLMTDNFAIGGHLGWKTMYEKLSNLPPIEVNEGGISGDISGTQLRYLNVFPTLVTGHYYFDSDKFKPYIGIGLGGVYVEQRLDIGLRSIYTDSFAFGAQPEIGVFIPMGYSDSGINLALRYLYGTSAGELESLSIFTLSVGFAFMN